MIYVTNEIRAKVWHVGNYNGFKMVSITTSEKTQSGKYVNSSWFARLMSQSKEALKDVKKGDCIIVKRCALRNTYNKEKEREYLGLDIYEAEIQKADGEPSDNYE